MKKILLTVALSPLLSVNVIGTAAAAPCMTNDTLASLIALGNIGCSVDDKLFSNFSFTNTSSGGAFSVTPAMIFVSPAIPTVPDPGLHFQGPWVVSGTPPSSQHSTIDYTVTDLDPTSRIKDASLAIQLASLTGNGTGTVSETLAGPSPAPPVLSAGVPPGSFSASAVFNPVVSLDVSDDILVTAPDGNSFAVVAVFEQRFSETTVPEPTTLALLGTALIGIGLIRRRKTA